MITQVGREMQHLSAWELLSEIFSDKNVFKYMKKCSISRTIREVQINTMM